MIILSHNGTYVTLRKIVDEFVSNTSESKKTNFVEIMSVCRRPICMVLYIPSAFINMNQNQCARIFQAGIFLHFPPYNSKFVDICRKKKKQKS